MIPSGTIRVGRSACRLEWDIPIMVSGCHTDGLIIPPCTGVHPIITDILIHGVIVLTGITIMITVIMAIILIMAVITDTETIITITNPPITDHAVPSKTTGLPVPMHITGAVR